MELNEWIEIRRVCKSYELDLLENWNSGKCGKDEIKPTYTYRNCRLVCKDYMLSGNVMSLSHVGGGGISCIHS